MERYSVKEVADMSGVSVRTLHYYDQIGLLRPGARSEAGYRSYGETELLRLQQILFYKELGFSLQEIRVILDDPAFDLIAALEAHRQALTSRQQRLSRLLATIEHTIDHLKNGDVMKKPEMLYEGLPKEVGTTYRREAMEKYGEKTVTRSEAELMKLGKEGFAQLQAEFQGVNDELFALRGEAPDSQPVQAAIARHYACIRQFWGTTGSADMQAEAYAGLGELYVSDERFTRVKGEPQPAFARFLAAAMGHFAATRLR
ncbi:MAG: MerR family transcriptional regulator [Lewinella sp.]|nr:MerR family transcriptional regulator [Lewinella sp.]